MFVIFIFKIPGLTSGSRGDQGGYLTPVLETCSLRPREEVALTELLYG